MAGILYDHVTQYNKLYGNLSGGLARPPAGNGDACGWAPGPRAVIAHSSQGSCRESKITSEPNPWRKPKVKPGKPSSNCGNGINTAVGTE